MLFRVYNKENRQQSIDFFFFFLQNTFISWQWSESCEGKKKDTFICSTLIKSLQVELKSIITSNVTAGRVEK